MTAETPAAPSQQPPPPAAPPAPAPLPPRHWGLKHDREKIYFHRCGSRNPPFLKKVKAWLWDFELGCIAVYRLGQLAMARREAGQWGGLPLFLVYAALWWLVRLFFHLEISPKNRFGPGFHLGHPYTILIGPTVVGANCSVTHNVTIGLGLRSTGSGYPVIGDNVWIGPGATLIGPITVGDGAAISAGSVVTKDVPARALVSGNPARVVTMDYDTGPLIGYTLTPDAPR